MRALIADALGAVAAGELVAFTLPAPRVAFDRAWALPVAGPAMAWAEPGGLQVVGHGEAARVEAAGEGRFAAVRARGHGLLAGLAAWTAPGAAHAPAPRLYGGFAFDAGTADEAPWAGFGDASFVLPRWVYGCDARGAFAQLAVRGDELAAPGRLLDEVARVEAALRAGGGGAAGAGRGVVALFELPVEAWSALVERALGEIRSGAYEKVVVARRSHCLGAFDVGAVVARLGAAHPECVRFALPRGGGAFVGATPERLVVARGATLETDALAGSVPRGGDDAAAAAALLASDKERREHDAVVRGVTAALASLGATPDLPGGPRVRALKHVLHLWTPVTARAARDVHVLDAVAALHPTPAVCGLPRGPAGAWIRAREPAPRGWYAAPVGWFDARGHGAFAVGIRSAVVRGREAWLYAGAGIVEGSEPAREYAETAAKQRAVLAALGGAP